MTRAHAANRKEENLIGFKMEAELFFKNRNIAEPQIISPFSREISELKSSRIHRNNFKTVINIFNISFYRHCHFIFEHKYALYISVLFVYFDDDFVVENKFYVKNLGY